MTQRPEQKFYVPPHGRIIERPTYKNEEPISDSPAEQVTSKNTRSSTSNNQTSRIIHAWEVDALVNDTRSLKISSKSNASTQSPFTNPSSTTLPKKGENLRERACSPATERPPEALKYTPPSVTKARIIHAWELPDANSPYSLLKKKRDETPKHQRTASTGQTTSPSIQPSTGSAKKRNSKRKNIIDRSFSHEPSNYISSESSLSTPPPRPSSRGRDGSGGRRKINRSLFNNTEEISHQVVNHPTSRNLFNEIEANHSKNTSEPSKDDKITLAQSNTKVPKVVKTNWADFDDSDMDYDDVPTWN